MPNGDDAVAAGMDKVLGTADRRQGYDEINKTRDYIAQRTNAVVPVAKGGTGSTTPTAAKASLEVVADKIERPNNYGTIEAGLLSLADIKADKSQVFTTSQTYDRGTLDAAFNSRDSAINGKRNYDDGYYPGDVNASNVFARGAFAANSNYVIAYMNGDNRLSRGASSERYKKYLSEIDPESLGDIWPAFHRFQMRSQNGSPSDNTWRYGYIAERLAEHPDQERFVVYADIDGDALPDSIDFIGLLLAQNAQLHQVVAELAARVAALEANA